MRKLHSGLVQKLLILLSSCKPCVALTKGFGDISWACAASVLQQKEKREESALSCGIWCIRCRFLSCLVLSFPAPNQEQRTQPSPLTASCHFPGNGTFHCFFSSAPHIRKEVTKGRPGPRLCQPSFVVVPSFLVSGEAHAVRAEFQARKMNRGSSLRIPCTRSSAGLQGSGCLETPLVLLTA